MSANSTMAKPDMVIGVDFGMTCSGVGYANLTRGESVKTIQKWPERSSANENKTPTVICYPRGSNEPCSWGFATETILEENNGNKVNKLEGNDGEKVYIDWFKTYLDENILKKSQAKDPENCPPSIAEVERWTLDYMRFLYQHIHFKLSAELPQHVTWETATIETIFSVPTTWTHATVERFRSILLRAGFGQHQTHTVSVGLTEAEAAAVNISVDTPGLFQENEVLLVCDVGGGTTDLSVLRVQNVASGALSLKQLDVVAGRNLGSILIDSAFEDLALHRLQEANRQSPMGIDLDAAAWHLMKSKTYQNAKCDFGSPDDTPIIGVTIPGLDLGYYNERYGISRGAIKFSSNDLKGLFDVQVQRLLDLIDKQIQSFQEKNPGGQIAHLVLSGGLGNSAYVQKCLEGRYAFGASPFVAARGIRIAVASDPQLAVCKGIVMDRVRKLSSGQAVLRWRCSRQSYGTICKILYDRNNPNHMSKRISRDPLNGKDYIMQAVAWFIKKGEPINVDFPISHTFSRKITPGDPRRAFPTQIIVSNLDKELLPLQLDQGAEVLCEVKSDLSGIDEVRFKLKNRHWWSFGTPYRRCTYQINVVVGPADITFELIFQGQKLSKDNPISVEWLSATEPAVVPDTEDAALNSPAVSRSRAIGMKNVARNSVAMLSNISLPRPNMMNNLNVSLGGITIGGRSDDGY